MSKDFANANIDSLTPGFYHANLTANPRTTLRRALVGKVTPMRRSAAKPAADPVEELDLDDLDLDDLTDLEDVDLENEPEIEEPVKAPAKKKAAPRKPAPKKAEEPEEVELDFEDEVEEPAEETLTIKVSGTKAVATTKTATRKTAHDVVEEGTDMTAYLRGFAAGKYGVDLSEEDAARVDATLKAAEQDHTGNLFAYLIGSSTTETASATVVKSPGVTQVVPKAKAATKVQTKAAAKTAPKSAAKPAAAGKAEVGSNAHMRAWLRKNGYPQLGDRGRLPGPGVEAYNEAH